MSGWEVSGDGVGSGGGGRLAVAASFLVVMCKNQ